jgi:hypothetical protein
MTALWGGVGVFAGAGFATVGALARSSTSLVGTAATALMSGALAGEAVLMLGEVPIRVPAAHTACLLELGLAAAVAVLPARRARLMPVGLVLSAVIAVTAIGAVSDVRSFAFSAGWGAGHQLP